MEASPPPTTTTPTTNGGTGKGSKNLIIVALAVVLIVVLGAFSFLYLGVSGQNSTLNSQIASEKSQIASDESKISALQSQISSDQSQLSTLQSVHSTDQATISSLNSQIASDESQISSLEAQIANMQSLLSLSVSTIEANKKIVPASSGHPGQVVSFSAQDAGYLLVNWSTPDTFGNLNITFTPSNTTLLPFADFPVPPGSFYFPTLPGTVAIVYYTSNLATTYATVNATYVS